MPRPCVQHAAIKFQRSLCELLSSVVRQESSASGSAHFGALGWITYQRGQGRAKACRIARFCEKTRGTLLDDFLHPSHAASYGGFTEHHGLDKNQSERLVARWADEDIAFGKMPLKLRV